MAPRKSKANDLKADHDPQVEHEEDMREDDIDSDGYDQSDEGMKAKDAGALDTDPQAERKVEVMANRTIINGHVLPVGCVIKMRNFNIEAHRSAGVPLADVSDHDDREIYDVSEPFVAQEGA